jgi:hypothetical protein
MRNISLKLFTLSVILLAGCEFILDTPNTQVTPGGTGGSSEPFQSASPSDSVNSTASPFATAVPTAVPQTPSPVPTPKTGGYIKFINRTIDWGSLNAQEQARTIVKDFDNRRLVIRPDPEHVDKGGEYELTWDAPPAEISVDQTITLNIKGKINIEPDNFVASAISVSSGPNGFFDASPAETVTQNTGRLSHGELDQGTKQISLRPSGINNLFYKEDSKIAIYFYTNYGPTIAYNYQLIRNK